jgi:hypothetical protein
MTVKELIARLYRYDPDREVLVYTNHDLTHNYRITRIEDVAHPDRHREEFRGETTAVCLVGDTQL